jgi:hypothetical protein
LFAALVLGASITGYQRLFSTFNPLDDEGYVMLSLASVLEGQPLYDATYSQYGPAFFEVETLLHRWTGLPVSHDVTRLKSLLTWLAVAGVAAAFIYRLTASRLFSACSFLLCFFHLERLVMEPGHPQELCALLVTATLYVLTFCRDSASNRWAALLAGLCCGVLSMMKINMGGLLSVAVALTFVLSLPRHGARTVLLGSLAIACLALPWVLTCARLQGLPDWQLPAAVTAGLAATLVAAGRHNHPSRTTSGNLWSFIAAHLATCLVFSVAVWLRGTSWRGLFSGLVWQHVEFGDRFYAAAPLSPWTFGWAISGLGLSFIAIRRSAPSIPDTVRKLSVALLLAMGVRSLLDSTAALPIPDGGHDVGSAALLIGFVTPWVWVALSRSGLSDEPSHSGEDSRHFVARLGLCLVAALQPLGAFPIPGTQLAVGSVPLVLVTVLLTFDLLQALPETDRSNVVFRRVAIGMLSVLLVSTLLWRDVHHTRCRRAMTALELPGAARLRLPAREAEQFRWLTRTLRSRYESFVAFPNAQNSVYFWTQMRPLSGFNATLWPIMLNDQQQLHVVDALRQTAEVGVIRNQTDQPARLPATPLVRYLETHFAPVERHNAFELWERRR